MCDDASACPPSRKRARECPPAEHAHSSDSAHGHARCPQAGGCDGLRCPPPAGCADPRSMSCASAAVAAMHSVVGKVADRAQHATRLNGLRKVRGSTPASCSSSNSCGDGAGADQEHYERSSNTGTGSMSGKVGRQAPSESPTATLLGGRVVSVEMVVFCFDVLKSHLQGQAAPRPPPRMPDQHFPLFVTWKVGRERRLRGCIGTFNSCSLHTGLREYAVTSALKDTRFAPISADELPRLHCSVSVLMDFEPAAHYLDWTIGVHGIRIEFHSERGAKKAATYLPEVALEQGWDQVQTIDSLMRKGGHKGAITSDCRARVCVVRFRSDKLTVSYHEYVAHKHTSRRSQHALSTLALPDDVAQSSCSSMGGAGAGGQLNKSLHRSPVVLNGCATSASDLLHQGDGGLGHVPMGGSQHHGHGSAMHQQGTMLMPQANQSPSCLSGGSPVLHRSTAYGGSYQNGLDHAHAAPPSPFDGGSHGHGGQLAQSMHLNRGAGVGLSQCAPPYTQHPSNGHLPNRPPQQNGVSMSRNNGCLRSNGTAGPTPGAQQPSPLAHRRRLNFLAQVSPKRGHRSGNPTQGNPTHYGNNHRL